jgi:hypothetical protein
MAKVEKEDLSNHRKIYHPQSSFNKQVRNLNKRLNTFTVTLCLFTHSMEER